jgi:hypothetical protein
MAVAAHIRRICATAGLVIFLAASLGCPAGFAAEPKQVVLLHSFGRDFKPWSEYARAIRIELDRQSPWPLDITEHSLVTARSPDEDPEVTFVEYLRALAAKRPPDIIVSIGAPAAAFVQRHRQRLFATTPMVFTAVDQRRVQYSSLTANDAVVALRINYLSAFENILQVLPDTKDVIVVVGTSPIEKFWKEAIGKEVEPLANRIKLSWTDELSFEALLKQASALPPHTAIFWELMIVDAAGVVHEGGAPLARLHAVANAPIFSYDESFFGNAIVGGPLLLAADTYPAGAVPSWRTEGTPTLREKSRTRANARAEMSPTGPVREANGQRHQLEERAAHGASRGRGSIEPSESRDRRVAERLPRSEPRVAPPLLGAARNVLPRPRGGRWRHDGAGLSRHDQPCRRGRPV